MSRTGRATQLSDDLIHNILSKLPAKSFASAACVSHSWNDVTSRILSRPSLSSSFSLNPSLPEAIEEVVGKVLSSPIRPHFAIVSVCSSFSLTEAHSLVTKKLGSCIPVVTCEPAGIMGRDAITDRFQEVKFPWFDYDYEDRVETQTCGGISLTVGYVPGLKVGAIPLLITDEGSSTDKFVMEISDYSASVSGCASPKAIIMFGDLHTDMKPVLQKLDCGLSKQTVIAGNESCRLWYGSTDELRINSPSNESGSSHKVLALVFVTDGNKVNGLGRIEFHLSVGAGLSAVGPTYKVVSARKRFPARSTWLTAKRQGENLTLDGEQMLEDVGMEELATDVYIGVTKRRKCAVGDEKKKLMTYFAYHPVQSADGEYLYVRGWDIKTGDPFRFFVPDQELALSSSANVSEKLKALKHKEIVGAFIFGCCARGSTFFEKPDVDSSPVLDNFPSIPLAGMFCGGEIGRGLLSGDGQEVGSPYSCLHAYSTVYLLLSYSSPPVVSFANDI